MRTRREFLVAGGAGVVLLAAPAAALAQPKQKPVVIGWLHFSSRELNMHQLAVFKEGLAALGWKEGVNYVLEERWADGRRERLQPLAEELAARKPALIVAGMSPAVRAAAGAAPALPVVITDADPLNSGLVASLARPGGMITGVSNVVSDVQQKFVELLLAAVPEVKRIGALIASSAAHAKRREAARRSATQHSVDLRFEEVNQPEEIEPAISRLAKQGVQALVVFSSPLIGAERPRILKLALAQRWPVVGFSRLWVEGGALLSYGYDISAGYRRVAYYVDRILKGAKPGDLPIEQPTKFELVVNLKTAKALGLNIPQPFLMRADRVIE